MQTTSPEIQPWFGLRVRSRSEQLAATALEGKGYNPFLPVYKVARKWSDRVKEVEVPLFPGYVFCRFDPQRRLPILTTAGVVSVVGIGKVPAPIEDQEIAAIAAVIESGLPAQPWPFTRVGDEVSITDGPLRGMQGIVTQCGKDRRLILSITMLQRSVSVEIDPMWARRIH
jgi:transcription antitermination factor NusG